MKLTKRDVGANSAFHLLEESASQALVSLQFLYDHVQTLLLCKISVGKI